MSLMALKVSEFLDQINILLAVEPVEVEGEVSEWKVYPSGVYFSIKDKDDGSVLRSYMHPSVFRQAGFSVEIGMEVKLKGTAGIYKPTGQFNFRATSIELVGEGALKKAYELLFKKLEAEGLFARKRPIPERIERIGIVSSKGGVVIQDFRKNLVPLGFKLYFSDSRVEGAQAVPDLVRAIRRLNTLPDLDVIVVMRGGGSLESMQAFNNELVCREVFGSRIPVIAGIGHDVDVPIAALVADAMVSTPTAAAHLVGRSWDGFKSAIEDKERAILGTFENALMKDMMRLDRSLQTMFGGLRHIFVLCEDMEKRFMRNAELLGDRIREAQAKTDRVLLQAIGAVEYGIKLLKGRMDGVLLRGADRIAFSLRDAGASVSKAEQLLTVSDPRRNLRLGYSIVFGESGKVVKGASGLKVGGRLRSTFAEGEVVSQITDIKK